MLELNLEEIYEVSGGNCYCICINIRTDERSNGISLPNESQCLIACRNRKPGDWDKYSCE